MLQTTPICLPPRDLPRAAALCARAFEQAPHVRYFFPQEDRRDRDAFEFFRMRIRYGQLFGEVHITPPGVEAVAVWLPSRAASMPLWHEVRAGGIRLYRRVGSGAVARMNRVSDHNKQLRLACAPDPHWLLSIVAVDPERQRRGQATALLRPMLDRFDRDLVSTYCETTDEAVLRFYERLGFAVGTPSVVPEADLSVWPLVRRAECA